MKDDNGASAAARLKAGRGPQTNVRQRSEAESDPFPASPSDYALKHFADNWLAHDLVKNFAFCHRFARTKGIGECLIAEDHTQILIDGEHALGHAGENDFAAREFEIGTIHNEPDTLRHQLQSTGYAVPFRKRLFGEQFQLEGSAATKLSRCFAAARH